MSEIPSDIASSAAQAGFQARETGKARDAARTGQTHAAERQVKSVDEVEVTVETTDDNTKVFSDAEGSGGQGRSEEEQTPEEEAPNGKEQRGITTDDDGHQHVDLEA